MKELSCHQAIGPQGENTIPTEVNKCPNPHTVKPLHKRLLDQKTELCINPYLSTELLGVTAKWHPQNYLSKRAAG
jgi:hypothetical protein